MIVFVTEREKYINEYNEDVIKTVITHLINMLSKLGSYSRCLDGIQLGSYSRCLDDIQLGSYSRCLDDIQLGSYNQIAQ